MEVRGIAFIVVFGSMLHVDFEWSGRAVPVAPIALVVLGILFVLFTLYPPDLVLFSDPITGRYGIVEH